MAGEKTAKLTVYTDETTKAEWERLSKSRNRRPSAEADVILRQELNRAYESGELTKPNEANSTDTTVSYETAVAILKANADKDQVRALAIAETAQLLGLDGEKLLEACMDAGLQAKNGNGTSKKKEVKA